MIRVGYRTTDNTDVTHQMYDNIGEANEALFQLRDTESTNTSIRYFYLETQITETKWQKYGYVDP